MKGMPRVEEQYTIRFNSIQALFRRHAKGGEIFDSIETGYSRLPVYKQGHEGRLVVDFYILNRPSSFQNKANGEAMFHV